MAAQRHTRIAYVLPSVVGMRLSIEREAKKIPLGDFPLCYNSQEAKKKHNGVFQVLKSHLNYFAFTVLIR